jgi:uncharacterized protein (DUF1330 family)
MERLMPAYVVAAHRINDPGKFEEYKSKIGPMVGKYGGRYLTRGDNLRMLEGGYWTPERVVIIEFPNMASLNAWYTSAEYQPLVTLRKSCTSAQDMTLAMEGL